MPRKQKTVKCPFCDTDHETVSALDKHIREGHPLRDKHLNEYFNRSLGKTNPVTNEWLKFNGMQVYVRLSSRYINKESDLRERVLDLASIDVRQRGKGKFTAFLKRAEAEAFRRGLSVFVENVFEERFQRFFEKQGYTVTNQRDVEANGAPPCYLKRASFVNVCSTFGVKLDRDPDKPDWTASYGDRSITVYKVHFHRKAWEFLRGQGLLDAIPSFEE